MKNFHLILTLTAVTFCAAVPLRAAGGDDSVTFGIEMGGNASTGDFAPYMIGSWQEDRTTAARSATTRVSVARPMDDGRRWGWGAGAEVMAGCFSEADYDRYEADLVRWVGHGVRPSGASLRSLYAEGHYRSIYIMAGMKTFQSKIVDGSLSSGDLVRSNNARPIPGITVGFTDFQDIPFTGGWLQIDGQVMYGKFADNGFRRQQFNYYNYLLATDLCYTYKYCYFRTRPSERFSAVFGMQIAGEFGGTTAYFRRGLPRYTDYRGFRIVDVLKMFLPTRGNGNGFYEGNTLGTWSLRARYDLTCGDRISACWEKFFEDGSGIACRNGMDGLYGLQYDTRRLGWLSSVVVEYLDFRNQSGPIHFAPGDRIDPTITSEATGGDDYYNNDTYGPYANYGMAIGSPMVKAPVYNLNGFPLFVFNRMRGVHLAAKGTVAPGVSYKLAFGWQRGYAMGRVPLPSAQTDVSALAEVIWRLPGQLSAIEVDCRAAVDRGGLRGNNMGVAFAVRYSGSVSCAR